MGNRVFAFVDEYGDSNLSTEKEGVSSVFIIVATIIQEMDLDQARGEVAKIQARYFPNGEIKSNRISDQNTDRRIQIVEELLQTSCRFIVFVIDKEKVLKNSGLRFRRTFYKFLNALLYQRLFRAYPTLSLVIDKIGSDEFMNGFADYVEKRHYPNLFSDIKFEYVESKSEPLVQASDLIAGTLARIFDKKRRVNEVGRLHDPIVAHAISIDFWPPYRPGKFSITDGEPDFQKDELVREHCLNQALRFVDKHESSHDQEIQMQVECLRHLLLLNYTVEPGEFVFSQKIVRHLKSLDFDINRHSLRNRVVAKLRDHGVVISSGRKGYKIPMTLQDVKHYVSQTDEKVLPMLKRLRTAREELKSASLGQIDIVPEAAYPSLKILLDNLR